MVRGELTCKLRDKMKSSLRSLFEEYSSGGDGFFNYSEWERLYYKGETVKI